MGQALGMLTQAEIGQLTVRLPNGHARRITGYQPGPTAELVVNNERMVRRFLFGGALGFNESYLEGDWSSPNLSQFFLWALLNQDALASRWKGKLVPRLASRLVHWLNGNSKSGSRKNISHHYDLGNAFYERWLDPSMTYSSALFAPEGDDLATGQHRKYTALCDRLGLREDDRVLEVGCGWGCFAEFAARERKAHIRAITISKEQQDYAARRVFEAGLAERVSVDLIDYRDVEGSYDKVASIEMFEAVGERYWPTFFSALRDRLVDGGRAALQVITIEEHRFEDYRSAPDYIQKYIFPGGMLPTLTALKHHTRSAGLGWDEHFSFGQDYARTCAEWNHRFQAAWPDITTMGFDRRFKRLWEQYLAYCEAGFSAGATDVVHAVIRR